MQCTEPTIESNGEAFIIYLEQQSCCNENCMRKHIRTEVYGDTMQCRLTGASSSAMAINRHLNFKWKRKLQVSKKCLFSLCNLCDGIGEKTKLSQTLVVNIIYGNNDDDVEVIRTDIVLVLCPLLMMIMCDLIQIELEEDIFVCV